MRALLPLLALAEVGAATSCARAVIYDCGHYPASAPVARVDVHARAEGRYDLEIMHVDGPSHGGMCSNPAYEIGEEATLLEMGGGPYTLLARAEDSSVPYAFPLRGKVLIEPGRCYVPAMTCDAVAHPDALACRLVLEPTACASRWLPRRLVIRGASAC